MRRWSRVRQLRSRSIADIGNHGLSSDPPLYGLNCFLVVFLCLDLCAGSHTVEAYSSCGRTRVFKCCLFQVPVVGPGYYA